MALSKRRRESGQQERAIPFVPFDEALKRMLSTPPDHKAAKKKTKDQKK